MSEKNLLVLGHKGMLGQMVEGYFAKQGYAIHRNPFRFDSSEAGEFINYCARKEFDIVINCIGRIKQKTEDWGQLMEANALLPLALNEGLREDQILVQPSTDCVFDGKKGDFYGIEELPNATDSYGWSKALGEKAVMGRANTLLIRVSIIGPDSNPSGKGLLSWFLSNPPKSKLNGYSNHLWNGITTLEWCKQVDKLLLASNLKNFNFYQLGTSESYSKFEMLKLFQEHFKTDFTIQATETQDRVDRRLRPTITNQSLQEQIMDLLHYQKDIH